MQQPEEIANFVEVTTRRKESTKLRIPLKNLFFFNPKKHKRDI